MFNPYKPGVLFVGPRQTVGPRQIVGPRQTVGEQWLIDRVLDSRERGCGFKPHKRHCVVSLKKNINPSFAWFNPGRPGPLYLKYWSWNVKNQNKQTNKLGKCADPDQTPQNVASDQGLHCLLTECSIDI